MDWDTESSKRGLNQLEAVGPGDFKQSSASKRSIPPTFERKSLKPAFKSIQGHGLISNQPAFKEPEVESNEKSSSSEEEPVRKVSRVGDAGTSKVQYEGAAATSSHEKVKAFVNSDDEEFEYVVTVPRPQANNKGQLEEDITKTLADKVLVHILFRQNQACEFQREEILRDVMGAENCEKFKKVISQVQFVLKETFRMILIGIKDMKTMNSSSGTFLLINTVPSPSEIMKGTRKAETTAKTTNLLYVVLTIIYMEASPLDAERIWSLLVERDTNQDFCPKRENFEEFLQEECVKKHYLVLKKSVEGTAGIRANEYDWGVRSYFEFCKMTMLRDVAKKMGNRDVKSFSYAYAEAKKQMKICAAMCRAPCHDEGDEYTDSSTTELLPE